MLNALRVDKYLKQRADIEDAIVLVEKEYARNENIDKVLCDMNFPVFEPRPGEEGYQEHNRYLIELCCEDESSLSTPTRSSAGCKCHKVTREMDLLKATTQ